MVQFIDGGNCFLRTFATLEVLLTCCHVEGKEGRRDTDGRERIQFKGDDA